MAAHPRLLAVCVTAAVAALPLAVVLTPWMLLALPVCLVAGAAAWLGGERFLQAVGGAHDDPGHGTPGLLP